MILNVNFAGAPEPSPALGVHSMADCVNMKQAASAIVANDAEKQAPQRVDAPSDPSTLDGVKILVAIAAFDFAQLPHLEEVLDAYLDMCVAGAKVDVVIHATVPYPVTLIDLLNSRLTCTNPSPRADFTVTIVLKTKNLRLHLVDEHRPLFYENINDYDLFIYSEDDIRVTPKTVGAYMYETERVKQLVGPERASDFNVGVARYGTRLMLCFLSLVVLACLLIHLMLSFNTEYNFPPEILIDDKTRHVTQNVTRVYWEHPWKPPIPKSVDAVPQEPLSSSYVHMTNHHQGMFIATRDLLKAWKEREGCNFDVVRDRPGLKGKPHQPAEGTQRVWMSSQMLYGNRHCNVQQVIPMDKFGALTVLHLPNKNYRRVGRKGRVGGNDAKEDKQDTDGSGEIEGPSSKLLTALQLHIDMRRKWPMQPQLPYKGIQMIDEVRGGRTPMLDRRMREFRAYEARGGVMSEEDMDKVALIDEDGM